MAREKVIFVDFRKGRRPPPKGFGGGPRFVFGLFLAVLLAELAGAAAALGRSAIASPFFAPAAVAVAVAAAVGVDKLVARVRLARLGRRPPAHFGGDHEGHTLH